jgi:hypothetical protein
LARETVEAADAVEGEYMAVIPREKASGEEGRRALAAGGRKIQA